MPSPLGTSTSKILCREGLRKSKSRSSASNWRRKGSTVSLQQRRAYRTSREPERRIRKRSLSRSRPASGATIRKDRRGSGRQGTTRKSSRCMSTPYIKNNIVTFAPLGASRLPRLSYLRRGGFFYCGFMSFISVFCGFISFFGFLIYVFGFFGVF